MPSPYSKQHLKINNLQHLSHRLGYPVEFLEEVASKADSLYKFEEQPKKNGTGVRVISKPQRPLKQIQKSIHRLLVELQISESAHCGIKKRSNVTNAKNHCNKKWLYSLDFKNFFPSISHHKINNLFFRELKCSPVVSNILTRLCSVNGQLPQGGSMSMDLANLICRKFDRRLEGLASKYNITYTRHCDDLCFSGDSLPDSFKSSVKKIIQCCGLQLNPDKEIISAHHTPQAVVGLRVNRKDVRVPRGIRREWRREEFLFKKYKSKNLAGPEREKTQQKIKGQNTYLSYVANI